MRIDMKMDTREVLRLLKSLPEECLPVAASRALNKTAVSAKSVAIKKMAANMGIAQKEIRPHLQLRKATPSCWDALLFMVKSKRLPLIKIDPKAKQGKIGVSYRGRERLQHTVPHAFIAMMPSGHRGIYVRKPGVGRLPIRELLGPSIDYVFKQPAIQDDIERVVKARWKVCCEQELRFLLQKKRLV